MMQAVHYPHIVEADGESPRLENWSRVRVAQIVMDHFGHAWSADEIARQYPHLTLAEIHSALAYYYDHREAIDHEIRAELRQAKADAASARRSPLAIRLANLAR
jgi:hypothetical protein